MNYDFSSMGKKGMKSRWEREHSKVRISKDISKEKVAINAYLCGDGHIVVRGFHYQIRILMDSLDVSKRIVELFKKEFNVEPSIRKRVSNDFVVEIKNKPVCFDLLSLGKYGSFEWSIPKNLKKNILKEWIKCFFDCEAYVNLHSKQIQVKSVNREGLIDLNNRIKSFGINGRIYGPYKQINKKGNDYSILTIADKSSIKNYKKLISFYHPEKVERLKQMA